MHVTTRETGGDFYSAAHSQLTHQHRLTKYKGICMRKDERQRKKHRMCIVLKKYVVEKRDKSTGDSNPKRLFN